MSQSPNLLFILADQWRAMALGAAGGTDPVHTPNLDRLAAQGMHLRQAVSNYPVCSPHRAMLMTGQYPQRNGVHSNFNSASDPAVSTLSARSTCWPEVLAAAGYRTAYVGKWHLNRPVPADAVHGEGRRADGRVWDAYTPPEHRHGFARWYAHGCSDQHFRPHYWVDEAPREEPVRLQQWSAEHESDQALRLLQEHREEQERAGTDDPFALMLSYNPPHPPFEQVPQRYVDRYRDVPVEHLLTRANVDLSTPDGQEAARAVRLYFAAVTGVDEQIGRVLAGLEELGLSEDTLVVFTSDHGMQLGSHGLQSKNIWFEESLRVPFLARLPGRIPAGTDDVLLSTPDIAPTLLHLLGQEVPASMQGRDLSGALRGWDFERPGGALYLRMPSTAGREDWRGWRTADRLLVCRGGQHGPVPMHLYDLAEDPWQLRDVLSARPAEAERLRSELIAALAAVGDPWSRDAGARTTATAASTR